MNSLVNRIVKRKCWPVFLCAVCFLTSCLDPMSPAYNSNSVGKTIDKATKTDLDPKSEATVNALSDNETGIGEMKFEDLSTSSLTDIPQPSIIFQTGTAPGHILNCKKPLEGSVWYVEPPYDNPKVILSDVNKAYINPKWSSDGQWVAYWQSEVSDTPSESIGELSWQFQEDSVWIMHPDGTERRQVSETFIRSSLTRYDHCNVTGGILRIIGWSENSQWLAFLTSPMKSSTIIPELYFVSVNSGELKLIQDVPSPEWMPNSNYLVGINYNEGSIEIINVDDDIAVSSLIIPDDIMSKHKPLSAQIFDDSNRLWVVTTRRNMSYYERQDDVWVVDTKTSSWKPATDIAFHNHKKINIHKLDGMILFCGTRIDDDNLEARMYPPREIHSGQTDYCGGSQKHLTEGWTGAFVSHSDRTIVLTDINTFRRQTLVDWEGTQFVDSQRAERFDWFLK